MQSIEDALVWFRRTFPVEAPEPRRPISDGAGNTRTLWLAGYQLELVEAAGTTPVPQGFRHLTIDVDPLVPFLARLEAEGIRATRGAGNAVVELDGATLLLRECAGLGREA